METVTATKNNSGERIRIKLSPGTRTSYSTRQDRGIAVVGVWVGKRWVVVLTDSVWNDGSGACVGYRYRAYDLTDSTDQQELLTRFDEIEEIKTAIDKLVEPTEL
ncbi:hypothetical protein CCP2SC5_920022 [Azospirillaceae bacterium]